MFGNSSITHEAYSYCSNSKDTFFISIAMIAVKTVLSLLLCTFILFLGYQQHQSKKTATHSDLFTYHLAAMELFWCPGFLLYAFGHYSTNRTILLVSNSCFSFTFFGEVLFHLLTCVEWYLAVVHPITYLSLRNTRGVRMRNISIGSVWLMSFGLTCFYLDQENFVIAILSVSIVSILVITFCSTSVLCVLIHPQTGKNGGKKRGINQSKLRAFHTVTAISSVLWWWFGGVLVSYALSVSTLLSNIVECVLIASMTWLNLPTFLVSPVLYLHGAGKLFCNCYKSK